MKLFVMFMGLMVFPASLQSFEKGEKTIFAIKKLGMKAGEASLTFQGGQKFNGRDAVLIVFRAQALNFFDEEKIYVDHQTLYPLRVERDLNIWGNKEKIVEDYSQPGLVRIMKKAGDKIENQIIEKKGPIDNIYSFIYRFRQDKSIKEGDTFKMILPTKDVEIKFVKTVKIKAGGQIHEAYYLQSDPRQYQVWFDTSSKRTPLRIDGSVGIMSTSMVMDEYQDGEPGKKE
jgi:hypothetical protein